MWVPSHDTIIQADSSVLEGYFFSSFSCVSISISEKDTYLDFTSHLTDSALLCIPDHVIMQSGIDNLITKDPANHHLKGSDGKFCRPHTCNSFSFFSLKIICYS